MTALYVTYLPLPLVLITNENGGQDVHIAPEAFTVSSAEFKEQMSAWQSDLPYPLRGQLESVSLPLPDHPQTFRVSAIFKLSGAKVLLINGEDPFIAVNKNTETTGGYQSFGTRQNSYGISILVMSQISNSISSFFASYHSGAAGWEYYMGNFAQHVHPLTDEVELIVQRTGRKTRDTFKVFFTISFTLQPRCTTVELMELVADSLLFSSGIPFEGIYGLCVLPCKKLCGNR